MNPSTPSSSTGNTDGTYDARDLFGLLLRGKRLILLTTFIVVLLGGWFTFSSAPQYEVRAKISYTDRYRLMSPAGEWSGMEDLSPAAAEIDILNSFPTLTKLIGEVHADGTRTGLGLRQQVQDVANLWPWPRMKSKLFGIGAPLGGIQVWADGTLPLGGIEIQFLDQGVKLTERGWFGASKKFDSFGADQALEFLGRNIFIDGDGVQPGRVYYFKSDTLYDALEDVRHRLKVNETLRNSGVLEVRYTDHDPDRAANILNRLLEYYIELDQQRLSEPATYSRQFLEKQKEGLLSAIEAAGQRLADYYAANESAIALVPTRKEGSHALETQTLDLINRLVSLELEWKLKEYKVQSLEDLVRQVNENQLKVEVALQELATWELPSANPADANQAAALLDQYQTELLQRLSKLAGERRAMEGKHPDDWVGFVELDGRIEQCRADMTDKLKADLQSAKNDADMIEKIFRQSRDQLDHMPVAESQLAGLQHHVTALNEQLLLLMTRLEKATLAEKAALATPTMTIIDPATPPLKAKFPRPVLTMAIALILGFVAGIILALLKESLHKPLLSSAQLQRVTAVPSLGTLPQSGGKMADIRQEAMRALRLNLVSLTKSKEHSCVAITSAGAGEGSSTTAADLATVLAQGGDRVLLVDANLRQPTQADAFDVNAAAGFADKPADEWHQHAQKTSQQGLFLLSSGSLQGHPGECAMQVAWHDGFQAVQAHYDWVIVDAPAFLSTADCANVLQSTAAVVMVNRYNFLSSRIAKMAADRMRALQIPLAACVLNGHQATGIRGYVDGYAFDRAFKRTAKNKG